MLYRHEDFMETLVHQCADADKYVKARRQELANVRKHDFQGYLSVPVRDHKGEKDKHGNYPIVGHETVYITHCPFCGIKLDEDETTGEFLDLKLL